MDQIPILTATGQEIAKPGTPDEGAIAGWELVDAQYEIAFSGSRLMSSPSPAILVQRSDQ